MNETFCNRLIELRHEKGINQREFAKSIDRTQAAVSRWEKGLQIPDIESLVAICNFLDISADYLLGIED